MIEFVFALVGFACGGLATIIALDAKRKKLQTMQADIATSKTEHELEVEDLRNQQQRFSQEMKVERESLSRQVQERIEKIQGFEVTLKSQAAKLEDEQHLFNGRVISYKELNDENSILKRDLRNLAIGMRKLELDQNLQQQSQSALDEKVTE